MTLTFALATALILGAQFIYPPAAPASNLIEEARVHMWTYDGLRYKEFVAVVQAAYRVNVERSDAAVRNLEREVAKVKHEGARRGLESHVDSIRHHLSY